MQNTIEQSVSDSTLNLGYASVSLLKNGIINTNITINDSINLDQAKELFAAYLKVGNKKKLPHLFTISKLVIMDKEVMEYMANVANKMGKADAFVIHSLPQKLIGNFYLRFYKPSIPTKLFTSKTKAIKWLLKHKK